MQENLTQFQPGVVLHEAIIGAFKARGLGFQSWCDANGINSSVARNATFGQSRGEKGKELLSRIIEAAGPDWVRRAYEERMREHVSSFEGGER